MKAKHFLLAGTSGVLIGLLIAAVAALVVLHSLRDASHSPITIDAGARGTDVDRSSGGLEVLWNVPPFDYVDQDDHHVTSQSLRGHPWIADFIFTRCTTACPVLTARMILLQRKITDPDVKFVSFSVDPAFDTPPVLKKYARDWHGDESRWRLLNTIDDATLHETASGMHVAVQRSNDPRNPILHTNRFALIDARGRVRGLYDSTDDQAVRQLIGDLQTLMPAGVNATAKQSTATSGDGKALFLAVGCLACHARPAVAPALDGVAGTQVELEGGGVATAAR